MRFLRLLVISFIGFAVVAGVYHGFRHDIRDWYGRLTGPNFDWPPDIISVGQQAALVAEYKRRGYDLQCFSGLKREEKISKEDDYLCWAWIRSAYDNIPARMVTFFFSKGELAHVRVEFPDSSFPMVMSYLKRRLANSLRLDRLPGKRFGTDIHGKELAVWRVQEGLLVTSVAPTAGRSVVILWSRMPPGSTLYQD